MSQTSTVPKSRLITILRKIFQHDYGILALLFLVGLIFRYPRLFYRDLFFDETVLLYLARYSFGEIWYHCKFDNFSPLFPWLVKLWTSVSWDYHWIRLLGALLGSLTAPAGYLLGKEISGRKFGLLLGSACAVSVSLVVYSQYVRMFNIQPFVVCLSMLWFLKAWRSNSWKFWILTVLADLAGFYVYYFMLLVVVSQGMVLVIYYRGQLKKYVRPLFAFLLFLVGILVWIAPVLQRYKNLNEGFWIPALTWQEYAKTWIFLGGGTDFFTTYVLAVFLNLPFLVGFVLALVRKPKNGAIRTVFIVLVLTIAWFTVISLLGPSLFSQRYFLFILPLYLTIALFGWMDLQKVRWKRLGLGVLSGVLLAGLIYYYSVGFDFFMYPRFQPQSLKIVAPHYGGDGRPLAHSAAAVAAQIQKDEVIIHFCGLRQVEVVEAFFVSRYYHQYSLPEYLYSREELTQYNGRQYMNDSARIASLSDIKTPPGGIWIVTTQTIEPYFTDSKLRQTLDHHKGLFPDNLFDELQQNDYQPVAVARYGKVSVIHFRHRTTGRITGEDKSS